MPHIYSALLEERERDTLGQIQRLARRYEQRTKRAATAVFVHPDAAGEMPKLPDGLTLIPCRRTRPNHVLVGVPRTPQPQALLARQARGTVEPGRCPRCDSERTSTKEAPTRLWSGEWSHHFYCKNCNNHWSIRVDAEGEQKLAKRGRAA